MAGGFRALPGRRGPLTLTDKPALVEQRFRAPPGLRGPLTDLRLLRPQPAEFQSAAGAARSDDEDDDMFVNGFD